jgi:hypothetical protein
MKEDEKIGTQLEEVYRDKRKMRRKERLKVRKEEKNRRRVL